MDYLIFFLEPYLIDYWLLIIQQKYDIGCLIVKMVCRTVNTQFDSRASKLCSKSHHNHFSVQKYIKIKMKSAHAHLKDCLTNTFF